MLFKFVNNDKDIIALIIDILPCITHYRPLLKFTIRNIVYYVMRLSLKSRYIFQTVTEMYNNVLKSRIVYNVF